MTPQLVYQRIRNRVIEMLEWLLECENRPPEVGMNELINSWEDWVPSPLADDQFPSPVFTVNEDRLLRTVSSAIDEFCEATPSIKDERAALALPQWAAVIATAQLALTAMLLRGKMPEEVEIQPWREEDANRVRD